MANRGENDEKVQTHRFVKTFSITRPNRRASTPYERSTCQDSDVARAGKRKKEKLIAATRAGTKIDIVERLIRSKSSGTTGPKVLPKYGTCSDKVQHSRYATLLRTRQAEKYRPVHGSQMASHRTLPQSHWYLPSCLTSMRRMYGTTFVPYVS